MGARATLAGDMEVPGLGSNSAMCQPGQLLLPPQVIETHITKPTAPGSSGELHSARCGVSSDLLPQPLGHTHQVLPQPCFMGRCPGLESGVTETTLRAKSILILLSQFFPFSCLYL